MLIFQALIWAFLAFVGSCNHQHHQQRHLAGPLVSSFSHQLPGTNSYMSVTRYFNAENRQQKALEGFSTENDHQGAALDLTGSGNRSSQAYFDPWNPRFKVARVELEEDEWQEHLKEVFTASGLLGTKFLRQVPAGMVNFNYDIHVCVHMGTPITPQESAYPPSAISYPHAPNKLHTLVLFDKDYSHLLWLIVNIPGSKVHQGWIVTAYAGPSPAPRNLDQKFIILALEQNSGELSYDQIASYYTENSCQTKQLAKFDIDTFRSDLDLSDPVAANFFTQTYNSFVDEVNAHCLKTSPVQAHPLYK